MQTTFSKRNPWYRLLVDDSSQMTYVEESLLAFDISRQAIDNPKVNHYLEQGQDGYYSLSRGH